MEISAVRKGLAAVVAAAIPELNCFGYVPNSIPEPAFVAGEVEVDFNKAMNRGLDQVSVRCRVLVSRAEDEAGQALLDAYLSGSGPESIRAAIEGTPGVSQTLGGVCDDLVVERIRGYRMYTVAGTEFYGAEFLVTVIGKG
ncbi:hypothetical protein Val02_82070 [Virgisporangium aliadipatigenens]|uniref:Uncharacterized protein n=1 Tax=Virgisporangium aliadipatigenens TaxID=741659 RepID=A0A8J3YX17_9ACTN|nr:hypothetical protein [Virgisporangium aliadipatigenens]GIJ51321.1 hypothetical protein Val02_82070 [Virgisporangium aliadipatigenens]